MEAVMKKEFGLRDTPIENINDENLGLEPYIKGLTNFIIRCETPMTIALQGDWGCGKTSMMNIIKDNLKEHRIGTYWFNTWQYSQFNMAENLPVLLISHLANVMGNKNENKWIDDIWKIAKKASEVILLGAGSVIGQKDAAKVLTDAIQSPQSDSEPTLIITKLREHLRKVISEKKQSENWERIVIFIDDLDRLRPIRAVELLECLKIFLDSEDCVFVIAIDYRVVIQGLQEKFGIKEAGRTGKSFFDKIIQMPFNMPIEVYQVDDYIKSLLKKTDFSLRETDVRLFRELIESSIGFNPRNLKRLLNALFLYKLVGIETKSVGHDDSRTVSAIRTRIVFALLCMQYAYPKLYSFLCKKDISKNMLEKFLDPDWINQSEFEPLRKNIRRDEISIHGSAVDIEYINQRIQYNMEKYANFLRIFIKALKLKNESIEEGITDEDVNNLIMLTKFSDVSKTERE